MEVMMNIAILGSGGREHAFAWRLSKESDVQQIDVIPGNPGMAFSSDKIKSFGANISTDNFDELIYLLKERKTDIVIVGPEGPLASGVVDQLETVGIPVLGPSQKSAQLESSKAFAKDFMAKYHIPTANFIKASDADHAFEELEKWNVENEGIVIKASELAGGKGVVVTDDREVAKKTIYDFLLNPDCTVNTKELVFEKKLTGREVSAFALCDGQDFKMLGYACDYKRLLDNDEGPNTGGMGCFVPKEWPTPEQKMFIEKNIIDKTLLGMINEGTPYKGILFVGLMINDEIENSINVIEYNVRFGDPEAQTLMPLLEGDFSQALLSAAKGNLINSEPLKIGRKTAIHVVMTSEGYPSIDGTPLNTGHGIKVADYLLENDENSQLFFAGVKSQGGNGENLLVNSGGRVLGLTISADSLKKARELVYQKIQDISFEGAFYRRDIGEKSE